MEGKLGEEQCLICAEQIVTSPKTGNKPLLPEIYRCLECHKDYENAHAYSGHFIFTLRMNLALNRMKRKEHSC
ncbi:hypothetical protein AQUCO_00900520v1 [Aquilegia coerulea]|uniref:Uncharacterized protein n=1 Tax=Aquilegia coerulea TaxID=218851 RepID=A0A2G5EE57_AQUCA|nr:hypothetical protein AQUCO_00900520v1 [Aquilegia coerulea]